MSLKKYLVLDYVLLGIGLLGLLLAGSTGRVSRRGLMLPQQPGLPQGPVKLTASVTEEKIEGKKAAVVSFKLKNTGDQLAEVIAVDFKLQALKPDGTRLPLLDLSALGNNVQEYDKGYRVILFYINGEMNLQPQQEKVLRNLTFDLSSLPAGQEVTLSVSHGYMDNDESVNSVVLYEPEGDGSGMGYDILSGLSGNLEIVVNQGPTSTPVPPTEMPTNTPIPPTGVPPTEVLTPTPPSIQVGVTLNYAVRASADGSQPIRVDVNLSNESNVIVDSVDLVLGYSQGIVFDPENVFVKSSQLGDSGVVKVRSVNNVIRRVEVSILDLNIVPGQSVELGGFIVTNNHDSIGPSSVYLVYKSGSSVDSNVNSGGVDILTGVQPESLTLPVMTVTPEPTNNPTPEATPTIVPPIETSLYLRFIIPLKVVNGPENEQYRGETANHRTLPALVWFKSNEGDLKPVWFEMTRELLVQPVVQGVYLYQDSDDQYKNVYMTLSKPVVSVTYEDINQADSMVIKIAGFLAKEISLADDGTVTKQCTQSDDNMSFMSLRCDLIVNEEEVFYPGDLGASGRPVDDQVIKDEVVSKYKQLLLWDENTKNLSVEEKTYAEKFLTWFGDDFINSFDTGYYPVTLGDLQFYIDWFKGVEAGQYKSALSDPKLTSDSVMMWTKWFNLLDADGNRYLNSLDWSLVHSSLSRVSSGDLAKYFE